MCVEIRIFFSSKLNVCFLWSGFWIKSVFSKKKKKQNIVTVWLRIVARFIVDVINWIFSFLKLYCYNLSEKFGHFRFPNSDIPTPDLSMIQNKFVQSNAIAMLPTAQADNVCVCVRHNRSSWPLFFIATCTIYFFFAAAAAFRFLSIDSSF